MRSFSLLALLALATSAGADDARRKEIAELKARTQATTRAIGKLASEGKLPTDDETIKLLRQMVDELAAIRERLKALEEASGQTRQAVDEQRRTTLGGYLQAEYRGTDRERDGAFDAFQIRRARFTLTHRVDPYLGLRMSFDAAAGTDRIQARLRDAYVDYAPAIPGMERGSLRLWMGQQNLPLGYEIERSSADRELPERSLYNRTLFNDERTRGVVAKGSVGKVQAHAGVVNALTIGDPEQAGLPPGTGSRLGVVAGARVTGSGYRVGVSGFAAQRAAFVADGARSPEVDRRFLVLDGEWRPRFAPRFSFRGEALFGQDRVPRADAAPSREAEDIWGFHLLGGYDFSDRHGLFIRWEGFDPNLDLAGDGVHGLGFAYLHRFHRNARLTAAYETFYDEAQRTRFGHPRYGVTTVRVQVRF